MSEDIENLSEIIELCQEELNKDDENITATLDLQDLKSLRNIINDYKRQLEINQEHQKVNGELRQKIKELEDADLTTLYLNGIYDERNKWRQKVKSEIEKLNQEEQELQNSISDEEREEYSDASIGHLLMDIEIRRNVLQKLLEKEK